MPVSERVRRVESEIDTSIREIRTWQTPRAAMLEQIMGLYRDLIEVVSLEFMHAKVFDLPPEESLLGWALRIVDSEAPGQE
jgi:hypothetical protein